MSDIQSSIPPIQQVVAAATAVSDGDLEAAIRHRIIGATPQMAPHVAVHHRRQLEIQAWLDGNGRSAAEWVALDDWPGSFELGFERIVLTDPQRAFDQDSYQELRSHFLRFAAGR
ncbi:hypothetical protein DBV14_07425 [Variovorax sp. KBW07]|uniref:HAD domain-containing protein n=1 Tax=Variovorax sp. KBW07 TaxID=2153358 RepID=UPI000F589825|nr:HAD domain-containing protein [Variovorax sp. KBW07]RQO59423.1 hypothetical protein DBV14_07425 [Variovorax sp. KBW07]